MHGLHPCFLHNLRVWNLVSPLDFFSQLSQTASVKMVQSLFMTLLYRPGLTCIQEGWQYHSLVDFQLGVKLDSIWLPDIGTESSKCHTGFCNSGSDLIINVHCSGEIASQVDELINNFQFCPFTVMFGSLYCFSGASWCTTSVFFVLIVRS